MLDVIVERCLNTADFAIQVPRVGDDIEAQASAILKALLAGSSSK